MHKGIPIPIGGPIVTKFDIIIITVFIQAWLLEKWNNYAYIVEHSNLRMRHHTPGMFYACQRYIQFQLLDRLQRN